MASACTTLEDAGWPSIVGGARPPFPLATRWSDGMVRTAFSLLFVCLAALVGNSQSVLSNFPSINAYARPEVAQLSVEVTSTEWKFRFGDLDVDVLSDPKDVLGKATVTFQQNGSKPAIFALSYNIYSGCRSDQLQFRLVRAKISGCALNLIPALA